MPRKPKREEMEQISVRLPHRLLEVARRRAWRESLVPSVIIRKAFEIGMKSLVRKWKRDARR